MTRRTRPLSIPEDAPELAALSTQEALEILILRDDDHRAAVADRFARRGRAVGDCLRWTDKRGRLLPDTRQVAILNYGGHAFEAARLSWLLHRGEIPEGHSLRPNCGRKHCVAPDHLSPHRKYSKKLSDAEVRAIREADLPPAETAAAYGISASHVTNIRAGRTRLEAGGVPTRPVWSVEPKLTARQVREIVRRYRKGGETLRNLGLEYGVSHELVRLCVTGRRRPEPGRRP